MIKKILSFLPLLLSLLVGVVIYCVAAYYSPVINNNLVAILINLASTLIGMTITYFSYTIIKNITERKLNKTLFEYSKARIDNEIINVLIQIQKMIYSFDTMDRSFNGLSATIDITRDKLVEQISNLELLGYQIFKKWDFSLNNIEKMIENAYTLKYLTNDQIITLVNILNAVEKLNNMYVFGKNDVFLNTEKISKEHIIVPPYQKNLPERSILLKKIDGKIDEGIVVDSGDIPLGDLKQALYIYKVKNIEEYVDNIDSLLKQIQIWRKLTGDKILIIIKDKRLWNPQEKKFVY